MQRTPVDYAMKYPNGWQRNPHYQVNPADNYQPLEYGPIDFYPTERKLAENNGVLFQQYRQNWRGCGRSDETMANDEKNRYDLQYIGAHGARVQLDDMTNPRFGPGVQYTERNFDEPSPYFDMLYGSSSFLVNSSKIGR
jgi:hypothetical protein